MGAENSGMEMMSGSAGPGELRMEMMESEEQVQGVEGSVGEISRISLLEEMKDFMGS